MQVSARLHLLADKLRSWSVPSPRVLVGFDGYVDKIQKVIHSKTQTGAHYFPTISEMAVHLATLAGRSGQIELVTQDLKIGGNGPIMANALASLGVGNTCVGTMNDAIFGTMHPDCQVVSVGLPGETNAMEFEDGKLIFSEVSTFERLTWPYLKNQLGLSFFAQQLNETGALALVDWANVNHCTALWQGLLEEVVKPQKKYDGHFFFDLCDPSKRSAEAICEALDVVSAYQPHGRVVLGMNENEARKIWLAIQGHQPNELGINIPDLSKIAEDIFDYARLDVLLIHPVDRSLLLTAEGLTELPGKLVRQPKVLTGGGDNLNAGFVFGLMHGFGLEECALLGMATSGAYIQNGSSPSLPDLCAYLDAWQESLVSA
jgi:hypothetical protein